MSIATRTLTINAAFLQEIKEDNQRLKQLFEQLRDRATWREKPPAELIALLEQLRDQLATHFTLEEAFGYFEDPIRVAPHLSDAAEELRAQHATMYAAASDLAESDHRGRGLVRWIKSARDRFDELDQQFAEHESRENALILQAFTDDIGVGD